MNYDHVEQGDYHASLYRLHQLTNRQLREEQLRVRRGPSLLRRMLNALGNSLHQRQQEPQPQRQSRLRLS